MKRTKLPFKELKLPDAINCSLTKNFTQVPNNLLRNPNITSKAKAILCLLLSNKEGWSSHIITIQTMMKEKNDAIRTGLQELEKHGYFLRVKYRDKRTKIWRGSFWAYTDIPWRFSIKETIETLTNKGLEPQPGFPDVDYPDMDEPDVEKPVLIIHNLKKTKINNTKKEVLFLESFPNNWRNNIPFQKIINEFIIHRKEIGKKITPLAAQKLAAKLTKYNITTATKALNQSIENNWTGVFPESENSKGKSNNKSGSHSGSAERSKFINYDKQL